MIKTKIVSISSPSGALILLGLFPGSLGLPCIIKKLPIRYLIYYIKYGVIASSYWSASIFIENRPVPKHP